MSFGSAYYPNNAVGPPVPTTWLPTTDTLGRTWTSTQPGSNVTGCPTGPVAPTTSTTWTVPGPANVNNGVRTFKFCYSTYNINTNFNTGDREYTNTVTLMTGVVLPDGTTWRFDYDNSSISYGDLMAVYPPTGGHISYTWTTAPHCMYGGAAADGYRTVATRTVYDGSNSYTTWRYNLGSGSTYSVTDPLGNASVYTFNYNCSVTQIQSYSGSAASGTLLKTVSKGYRDLPNPFNCDIANPDDPDPQLLQDITTVWPNGQQSNVHMTYDSGLTFIDNNPDHYFCSSAKTYTSSYGLVTSESRTDYGNGAPGPILSTTNTTYLALSNAPNASSYLSANLLDLPYSVVITDGSGNKCAETDYGYDEAGRLVTYTGTLTQHTTAPNSVRGNLTSMTKQLSGTPCKSGATWTPLPSTIYTVYDSGMRASATDPLNNTTSYSYLPVTPCTVTNYYGAFVTKTTFQSTSSPNPARAFSI
jgi:hypothetical protein